MSAVREVPFLVSPGGMRLSARRYFGHVLVSIGRIALAAEKQGEGSLAAAGCLDLCLYRPFDRGSNHLKSACLLGWAPLFVRVAVVWD